MEITGKLVQILDEVTGEGKNGTWRKQDFVIETQDEYPKKVCISTWGDKINLALYKTDDIVKVSVNLESREYNGKWYSDIKAWRVEKASAEGSGAAEYNAGDIPPPPEAPDFDANEAEDGDLPF